MNVGRKVVIAGGGMAGLSAAKSMLTLGIPVIIVEKEEVIGGHAIRWHSLFPDNVSPANVLDHLTIDYRDKLVVKTGCTIRKAEKHKNKILLELSDKTMLVADALLISTGFKPFDARVKEEYGYGIYPDVITSVEMEKMLATHGNIKTYSGKSPEKIAIIHCVGSRDQKVNNTYCSRVCCAAAVKIGISLKQRIPQARIYDFYMDMRMFGNGYEDLYYKAQKEYGITFIRGRLSETGITKEGSIFIKSEDTLSGKPLLMTVDMVVLMLGMVANDSNTHMANCLGLKYNKNMFLQGCNKETSTNISNVHGVFLAGTATAPMSVPEAITDGKAAAMEIASYLQTYGSK